MAYKYHLFPSLVITMTLIIARMVEGLHRIANNFPLYSSVPFNSCITIVFHRPYHHTCNDGG